MSNCDIAKSKYIVFKKNRPKFIFNVSPFFSKVFKEQFGFLPEKCKWNFVSHICKNKILFKAQFQHIVLY